MHYYQPILRFLFAPHCSSHIHQPHIGAVVNGRYDLIVCHSSLNLYLGQRPVARNCLESYFLLLLIVEPRIALQYTTKAFMEFYAVFRRNLLLLVVFHSIKQSRAYETGWHGKDSDA